MFKNINIKKLSLFLLVAMIISFALAGSVIIFKGLDKTIYGITGDSGSNEFNINQEETFELLGINSIDSKSVSSVINIIPVDEDKIKVHLYGFAYSPNENNIPKLLTNKIGDTLSIEVKHKNTIGLNLSHDNLKLDVYIPKNYSGNMNLESVSGEIITKSLNLNRVKASSVSGNIVLDAIHTKESNITTVSGSVNLNDFIGDLSIETISGEAQANFSDFNNNISAKSTSGEMNIKLPEDSQFNLKCSSISGEINNSFPISISSSSNIKLEGKVGNSNNNIKIETVSGSIEIKK